MWNVRLDEAQAGTKIAGRIINNLRYADDISLMAGSKEELKRLLMKMKEDNEKAGLKINIQKRKRIPEKKIYFCFIDYAKAFYCVDPNKLENS